MKASSDLKKDDVIDVRFAKGSVQAKVTKIIEEEKKKK